MKSNDSTTGWDGGNKVSGDRVTERFAEIAGNLANEARRMRYQADTFIADTFHLSPATRKTMDQHMDELEADLALLKAQWQKVQNKKVPKTTHEDQFEPGYEGGAQGTLLEFGYEYPAPWDGRPDVSSNTVEVTVRAAMDVQAANAMMRTLKNEDSRQTKISMQCRPDDAVEDGQE